MVDAARARRLAERIKVLAAEALEKVVKDQELGFVTITDVRVSPDLASSKIFYTVLGDATQEKATAEILERYRGRIRGEIGHQLGIRVTPTVEFLLDEVPESAAHLNDLLARARARDEETARQAKQASFAGDEKPYKEPKNEAD
jgi:ribosome-binding factor A